MEGMDLTKIRVEQGEQKQTNRNDVCKCRAILSRFKAQPESNTREKKEKMSKLMKIWKKSFVDNGVDPIGIYHATLPMLKDLNPSSHDVERVANALLDYQDIDYFDDLAGMFLSAIINAGTDENYYLDLTKIKEPLSVGFENIKNVLIDGNVGSLAGMGMGNGTLIIRGDAEDQLGVGMTGGLIFVTGNVGNLTGEDMLGGEIHILGNSGAYIGRGMKGGKIFVEKKLIWPIGEGMSGGEIHFYDAERDEWIDFWNEMHRVNGSKSQGIIKGKIYYQKKLVVNEPIEQLLNAWAEFDYSMIGMDAFLCDGFPNLVKQLKVFGSTAENITDFSLALGDLQDGEQLTDEEKEFFLGHETISYISSTNRKFANKAGIFLSALIEAAEGSDFTIQTDHLKTPPRMLGLCNTKKIVVNGCVGDLLGMNMMEGSITVFGDAKDEVGHSMEGGKITVKGNTGMETGIFIKGGEITVEGNALNAIGSNMEDGYIFINGNVWMGVDKTMMGGEIHIGGTIETPNGKTTEVDILGGKVSIGGKAVIDKPKPQL
jgi:formylmethanofuran dehydrogenase subunit C